MRRLQSTVWGPGTRVHLRWSGEDRTLCGRHVPWQRRPWPMVPCRACRHVYERVRTPDVQVDWVWRRSIGTTEPGPPG